MNPPTESLNPLSRDSADPEIDRRIVLRREIGLVTDNEALAALARLRQQLLIGVIQRLRQIDDDEHEVSVRQSLIAAFHALHLGDIGGGADTGGVDELDRETLNRTDFADRVAGSSGLRSDDGPFTLEQPIEQAGFAYVGASKIASVSPPRTTFP